MGSYLIAYLFFQYGAALSPRGLCFGIGDSDRTFELLNYLATNVQVFYLYYFVLRLVYPPSTPSPGKAERLLSYRRNGNRRRKAAEKELSLRSEIVRVYGTLQVSHSDKVLPASFSVSRILRIGIKIAVVLRSRTKPC